MNFVSSKAIVKGYIEGEAVILGLTVIGAGSLIGKDVMVGYPVRKKVKSFNFSKSFRIEEFDEISSGAKIGEYCIIRSNTVIYETATLGDYVETGHDVLIREGSVVKERSLIGSSTKVDGTVKIGRNVSVQSNVYLPHLTIIEDNVFIAPNVCFTNDPYPQSERLIGTIVEEGAVICANATLLPGLKIGRNSVVGAGSVVTKDVPAGAVVIGNPARFLMTREEFDEKKITWKESEEHL